MDSFLLQEETVWLEHRQELTGDSGRHYWVVRVCNPGIPRPVFQAYTEVIAYQFRSAGYRQVNDALLKISTIHNGGRTIKRLDSLIIFYFSQITDL